MSDLIGRQALHTKLLKWRLDPETKLEEARVMDDIICLIEDQPTAYDVEAVVRELEEERDSGVDEYTEFCFQEAIEIVKRGGRNERTD